MAYLVKIDGGDPFPIDDDDAATDEALRATLAPFYPLVSNAKIVRPSKVKDGEDTLITITKQAGPKGVGAGELVAAHLLRSRERINPAVLLAAAPEEAVAAVPPAEVERIVDAGVRETRITTRAANVLRDATPAASVDVPDGF